MAEAALANPWSRRAGLLVGVCAVGGLLLAACGGSSQSSPTTTTGGSATTPPSAHYTATSGDQQVCSAVKQAETDYQAKNYTAWRRDMATISHMAGTANDPQLKRYAAKAAAANRKPPEGETYYFLEGLGAFQGLRTTCQSLGQ